MKRAIAIILGLLPLLGLAQETAAIPPPETVVTATPAAMPTAVRVKDIARVQSARDNQLMGYGLVVGLNGTGDGAQTQFTTLALSNMLNRLGVTVSPSRMKVKNVAAVMVTADIGPFLTSGDRIDVTISSLGDAKSLQGGMLLQTPLTGANGKVYAVAQGAVSLGGYSAGAGGASKSVGHPTVGRIPNGALVEASIPMTLTKDGTLSLSLLNPDFITAVRMAESINRSLGSGAKARDAATIDILVPERFRERPAELIAALGELTLTPDAPARVVINERTGTVVVGGNVTITPVAVAQGNLTVTVQPGLLVSQPPPLALEGETVSRRVSEVNANEPQVSLAPLRGNTVDELVRTLNLMKVSPRDIIAILQAMKQAGALQADLQIL